MSFSRSTLLSLVVLAAFSVVAVDTADARVGGGGSAGSRGTRTYTAPPSTNTAPKAAAPIERSMTQPGKSATAQGAQPAPGAAASRFGGWRSLLMGGLIGAGLASLFGLGGLANVLGFVLQIALIGGIVFLVMAYFRSRNAQPQPAMASAGAQAGRPQQDASYRQAAGSFGGSNGSALTIGADDYDVFEQRLGEIQLAYGKRDLEALGDRVTPEMLSYFAEELDTNAKKGVRNEVSEPKLLQGDLAEAWSEDSSEYATLAMRYSMIDATIEASSGSVVAGDRTSPQEITEVWTFRRPRNGTAQQWELSAIQQA
jgi:predicted lipid-binding transport protein (Tim44 family)